MPFYFVSGWCLFGELLECVRSRFGHIVRCFCWSGWCILVLWCRQFLRRCWINAWPKTRYLLACLLDVHQSGIFARDFYILVAWLWRNAWRRVWISRMEHCIGLDSNIIIHTMHPIVYYLQNFNHTGKHTICKYIFDFVSNAPPIIIDEFQL